MLINPANVRTQKNILLVDTLTTISGRYHRAVKFVTSTQKENEISAFGCWGEQSGEQYSSSHLNRQLINTSVNATFVLRN